jgi:hypothetical protein
MGLGEEPALKKRVCENCRFFQEAGVAKSGWCNNPQRLESSDVKLVVRRNELACRNGWAQDLFSARSVDPEAADIVLHDTVSLRPLPAASVEERTHLVNPQREKPPDFDLPPSLPLVDVVVGQAPSTKPTLEQAPLLANDPRSAILKARERYRARMSAELRRGESGSLLDARRVDTGLPGDPVPPVRRDNPPTPISPPRQPRSSDVPPVQLSEVPRDYPTMTSFPEDEARFSSVPEPVDGIVLPRLVGKSVERSEPPVSGQVEDRLGVPYESSSATTSITSATGSSPSLQDEASTPGGPHQDLDVAAGGDVVFGEDEPAVAYDQARVEKPERRRFDLGRRQRDVRHGEVAVATNPVAADPATAEEVWVDDEAVQPLIDEVVADVTPIIEIAPAVPRMCRTCRDFRPADSGARGWCTNKWAFSHRRMVDADELPCETSVGCWWLPHDDVWLVTADVSAHGQPTPLVDHWLAHKVGSATTADEQRRRQRS